MEVFKIKYAPQFYYGNLGTSIEAVEDNSAYPDGLQPMSLIHFFAALSVILLSAIFGNALLNSYIINDWLSGQKMIINESELKYFARKHQESVNEFKKQITDKSQKGY